MNAFSKSRHWYVVATLPNRENLATEQLNKQGFKTYFPRRLKTVRHARKSFDRIVSYFPGYIFISLDLNTDRWRSVNGTIGVRTLLMGGETPLTVPCGVVENFLDMTDKAGFLKPLESLRPGDDVRVLNGPMADMIGKIDRLDGKHRARVLLDMLHGRMPLVVPVANVIKRNNDSPRQPNSVDVKRYSRKKRANTPLADEAPQRMSEPRRPE